jgi:hypothetical protein
MVARIVINLVTLHLFKGKHNRSDNMRIMIMDMPQGQPGLIPGRLQERRRPPYTANFIKFNR